MNRRTVLKAGIALAATGHTAIASEPVTLASMIDRHSELVAERKVLWDFVDTLCDSEACPPFGWIKMTELGRHHAGVCAESDTLHWPKQIDEAIDKKISFSRAHIRQGISSAHHEERIKRLEADRPKAHEILEARQKVYRDWRQTSGVTAADEESERLGEIIDALEHSIIDREAISLHEALLKAEWISTNWNGLGEKLRQEAVRLLVIGRAV